MIYGIGTDVCDIRRIRASLERHGERFAAKVLHPNELQTWRQRSARMPMTWRLCEIAKLPSGQPVIHTHGVLRQWCEARGLRTHVSVSDESDYATSFVIVETA